MTRTIDIGHRIELVPMDAHFHEITLALYQQMIDGQPEYLVHSYSSVAATAQRLESVGTAMRSLGGMETTTENRLRFPCGAEHLLGVRRLFLESCKVPPGEDPQPRPLQIFDKKSNTAVAVAKLGNGGYRVTADVEDPEVVAKRLEALAGGLVKLGQLTATDTLEVAFECGRDHDALLGLLLVRAPNVRAAVREQEQTAARGVLAAPSQQE
jgi:hypothetical protein